MKTISWSLALCLASVIPTLAAPGWNDDSNNNNRGSFRGGASWGRISSGFPKNYGPHGGYKQPAAASSSAVSASSAAATSSAAPSASAVASAQKSRDGTCGGVNGYTCKDSWFGDCCSSSGYCGKSEAYCAQGCQSDFGSCDVNTAGQSVSTDGSCGGSVTCQGSKFGDCCSAYGYCGSTSDYCAAGCKKEFGSCTTTSSGKSISMDGACGGDVTCEGSVFGNCCSQYGWCGSSSGYCDAGCKSEFGKCGAQASVSSKQSSTQSSAVGSSSSAAGSTSSAAGSSSSSVSAGPTAAVSSSTGSATSSTASVGSSSSVSVSSGSASASSSSSSPVVSPVTGSTSSSASVSSSVPASASSSSSSPVVSPVTGSTSSSASPSSSVPATGSGSSSSAVSTGSASSGTSSSSSSKYYGSSLTYSVTPAGPVSGSATASVNSTSSAAGSATASVNSTSSATGSSSSSVRTSSGATGGAYPTGGFPTGSYSYDAPAGTGSSSSLVGTGSSSTASVSSSVSGSPVSRVNSTSSVATTSIKSSPSGGFPIGPTSGFPVPSANATRTTTVSVSPVPSANSTSTVTSSTNTTSSISSACTSAPTMTEECIPCEGQPGNDPNSYCGYDINTNYYQHVPKTCRTVEYTLTVSNTTLAPDGVERIALLINGQMPGPLIEANWGDTVVVHLINALQDNGTSFHFHGVRQNYTSQMDGVPSITQCPLAPGQKMTYTWIASQYGTSWYHSHYAIQSSEGVFGPMIIHGPHAAPFDKEAGMIVLQDWNHQTVSSMYDAAQDGKVGGPRVLDNGLINGMNTWGPDGAANQTGQRFTMNFDHGKSYLLRLVNTAIQSTFKFYIDGHKFTVISTDFVPIKPYVTNILNINIGQRYNIIVHADQPIGDYWMRADNQRACAAITQGLDIKGIVHYTGGPMSTPTSSGYNYTTACVDEPYASIVPIVALNAMAANKEIDETVVVALNAQNLYRWYLDGTTFQSQFDDPTLYGILKNGSVPNYSGDLAIEVPELGEWVYIVIESPIPLPHPIHLHGHDFFVLGQGRGTYNAATSPASNLVNPPRRDVALLPAAGYLVLAFVTDNPGVWLMHCHIGWHTSMGFALQIIENLPNIRSTIGDTCMVTNVCDAWNNYAGLDSTTGIGNENSTTNGTTSNSNAGTNGRQIMFDSGV